MKRFLTILFALFLVFGAVGMAQAFPYEYYSGYQSVGEGDSYYFNFDLAYLGNEYTDSSLELIGDVENYGFLYGDLAVESAFVKVDLYSSDFWSYESAAIDFTAFYSGVEYDLGTYDFNAFNAWGIDNSNYTIEIDLEGALLADFATDPYGNLTITAATTHWNYNDFGITEVGIGVNKPVPEPGTIVLMGLGLVGLAGYGRKKYFKK